MKEFFKSVRRHIGRLDAEHLREQYGRISDEMSFLDTLFRTIAQGIIVLDPQGMILRTNPAAKDILGMEVEDALPSLGIPLGTASKREMSVTYPVAKSVELQTIPMEEGATLALLRDITSEKERTEEELRAGATRAVRDLAAGVAHEIGNPLNALSLNLQLLQRTHPDDPSITECISQVMRLDGILKGFLQALRASKPNLMPGSAAEPLTNCLSMLKAQLEERSIKVTLEAPGTLPRVALDKGQMEQVYFNLLKNAMEAIPDGGEIDVSLSSSDDDVIVSFRDNGQGMDEEQVVHLFEPYRTTKEHGTGLGLMISARIVRDHGGTIAVESKPGEGTVFTIRLPRLERRIRTLK